MTYEEQLNYYCDKMAKKTIKQYLSWQIEAEVKEQEIMVESTKILPLEKARVMVGGVKQTTDVNKGLKQVMGHQQARIATPNKKGK